MLYITIVKLEDSSEIILSFRGKLEEAIEDLKPYTNCHMYFCKGYFPNGIGVDDLDKKLDKNGLVIGEDIYTKHQ